MQGRREAMMRGAAAKAARLGVLAVLAAALAFGLAPLGAATAAGPPASANPLAAVARQQPAAVHGWPRSIDHAAAVQHPDAASRASAAPAQQVGRTNGTLGRWVVAALLTAIIALWITLVAVVVRVRLGTGGQNLPPETGP